MLAGRTYLRRVVAFIDIAAVAAFPSDITKAFEYFALFNVGS